MLVKDKKKPRFFEISLLNVFFCMFVVFVHASSKTISELDKTSWQYLLVMIPWRLASFVVAGFIFLSGLKMFLNKSSASMDYRKFFVSRLKLIILPYIIWVFIYYIYFYKHNYFPFKLSDFFGYVFVGNLVSHFYFVIIIVQFYLLAPLWFKLIKKTNHTILLIFSLMITILLGQNLSDIINLFFNDFNFRYTDRVFTTYLVYWIGGCYAGLHYEKFKGILYNNRIVISTAFLIATSCNAILSYLNFSGRQLIYWLENLHVMYCICAILFFYMISLKLTSKSNKSDDTAQSRPQKFKLFAVGLINNIDKISYEIYLSHCLVIIIINDYLYQFPNLSIGESYLIRLCTVYIITIGSFLLWKFLKNQAVSRLPFFKK